MNLYHFSDTARLPFILKSGILQPGRNKLGGFPEPDFLWATSQSVGDYTASGVQDYRKGKIRIVRFTLKRDQFTPWREIVKHYPQWTSSHTVQLEKAAAGKSKPTDWYCRVEALPLLDVLNIETRTWRSPWTSLEEADVDFVEGMPGALAITIKGSVYASVQKYENGTVGYNYWIMNSEAIRRAS